ncbi:MAG: DUF3379 domain-containing protein [Betaproteobacteria bacterium]|nr:DUF3379 domain-containing protein [Betaproteobacteria bacterium]
MNCFEFRRLVLAEPRRMTGEQREHMARCEACAALAKEIEAFETAIHDAAAVPVPEGLAERVLLRGTMSRSARAGAWALAASVLVVVGIGAYFYAGPGPEHEEHIVAAAQLGERHPAVAAISYVVDHESRLLRETPVLDTAVVRQALAHLGLKLPDSVTMRYLGNCPVPGGIGEHVVLETDFGHVTLILVPNQPIAPRVIVADRKMTALVAPVRTGGYILVTDSVDKVRQAERLLL